MWREAPGSHVAVLNMASAYTPGGGWLHGSGAQEENLHRRTTLCEHLHGARYRRAGIQGPRPEVRYPLPEFGGVFSPSVIVLRGCEADGYPFLVHPWPVSVLTVAAYHGPRCTQRPDGRRALDPPFEYGTRRKIRAMLAAAKYNRVQNLVLCAFGCGAFRNPPEHMAEIFVQCLAEPAAKGYFEKVTFAIIDDHNSPGGGNLQPFCAAVRDAYLRWWPPRVAPWSPVAVGKGKRGQGLYGKHAASAEGQPSDDGIGEEGQRRRRRLE